MSVDFDLPPVNDPLTIEDKDHISNVWYMYFCTQIQTLTSYLTQFGMLIPRLTTAQRNTIQSPQEGQLIYNIDATPGPPRSAAIQVWQVKLGIGAWRTFTTTP